jgi:hypothetical protein
VPSLCIHIGLPKGAFEVLPGMDAEMCQEFKFGEIPVRSQTGYHEFWFCFSCFFSVITGIFQDSNLKEYTVVFRFPPVHFPVAMHTDINVKTLQVYCHCNLIQRHENLIVIYDHRQE